MSQDALLLTPNFRLTAYFSRLFAEQAHGKEAWIAPKVQPLSSWLESLWCQLETCGLVAERLIKASEEELLWEQVIQASEQAELLLRVSATAKEAMKAFRLIQEWQLEVTAEAFAWSADSEAFYTWYQDFVDRLNEQGLICQCQLPHKLQDIVSSTEITLPKRIELYGFIETQPQIESFFSALQQKGIEVSRKEERYAQLQSVQYFESTGFEQELATAVNWSKCQFEQAQDSRIAIVINNLEDVRDQVERLFIERFEPDVLLGMHPPKRESFNISAGIALSQAPIIDSALQALMLQQNSIATDKMSNLLRSPFYAWEKEVCSVAYELDLQIRNKGNRHWPLKQLTGFIAKSATQDCVKVPLLRFLNDVKQQQKEKTKKALPSHWIQHWAVLLSQIGWPGSRVLSSEEFQAREVWQALLVRFSQADDLTGPITQQEALQHLLKQTGREVFQPQSPYARIQVLGPLEAAGMSFDSLWFLGLDDLQWPAAPKPTPFIPLEVQKSQGAPQSSPERECGYAKTLLSKIIPLTSNVVLSWAAVQEDKSVSASPLIQELLSKPYVPPEQEVFNLAAYLQSSHAVIEHPDGQALPVSGGEHKGGTSLLKAQAGCPFQAFARYRLGAYGVPPLTTGMTAMERGSVLHAVLENFWKSVKTQQRLLSLTNEERRQHLKRLVEEAIQEELQGRVISNAETWFVVERDTCVDILLEWLAAEAERPDFEVVATEHEDELRIGSLKLKVRLDRVDRLGCSEDLLLIDYKTGTPSVNDWFGDRPLEPQMPLYAVSQSRVKGLTYGYLRKGVTGFIGLSEKDGITEGLETIQEYSSGLLSWSEATSEWKRALEQLADDFCLGKAEVDPKHSNVCDYCDLSTLCRLNEKVMLNDS